MNRKDQKSQGLDSTEYIRKKKFYERMLTVYGRKPVLEAVSDPNTSIYRIHFAKSNRPVKILDEIKSAAEEKGVEVVYHDRKALSRISRNGKQDQGVAADVVLENYIPFEDFLEKAPASYRLIALDGIENPQNLGMIIRSVCAGYVDGILLPGRGGAKISPLVIKASAGTVFKAGIFTCENLAGALGAFKERGAEICTLASGAVESLLDYTPPGPVVYVLGNESCGVSKEVSSISDRELVIPMRNGVESLNVAVTAALIAFKG